jgi:hypothetical protein
MVSAVVNAIGSRKGRFALGAACVVVTGLLIANTPAEQSAAAAPQPKLEPVTIPEDLQKEILRSGQMGFVVTEFAYALGPDAATACPAGLSGGVRGMVASLSKTPAGLRRPDETQQAYERRLSGLVHTASNGQNLCMHPEAGGPDPNWRMVSGRNLRVAGIDLDGASSSRRRAAGDTCSHEEFQGISGERGVDNQFYRVVGCTTGFQSSGAANGFQTEMLTGSWGILISLKGVDDLRNDAEVEVGIYANADPIELNAARKPLPFATYATEQNPRYRAVTKGRIVDGVLTSDPTEVRVHNVVAAMFDDRVLRGARLRLSFTADGGMEGYLAGYTPVESMFDVQFGARSSRTDKGDPVPERVRASRSMGRAGALGHTCNGAYYALRQAADGDRDPKTGQCTSISTQYRIRMAPAFVVDARTRSINAPLTLR